MNLDVFRDYCLSMKGATECLPFDDRTLVFKVGGKMFAIGDLLEFEAVSLKCDPEKAVELRASHECVKPGFHLSKKHWNTIYLTGELSDNSIKELIKHSYECVFKGLPKKEREAISSLV